MNDKKTPTRNENGNSAAFTHPGKSGGNGLRNVVILVIIAAACVWIFVGTGEETATEETGSTFTAARGDLVISIVEGGNLKAQKSVQIECEVEGKATIVTLIPEGTYVKEGDLLVELDSSDLEERFTQQEIQYENAKASMIQAEENQKIQVSQNKSNIMEGELNVEFAKMELEKYLGRENGDESENDTKGSLELERKQLENEINIAEAEFLRATDRLDWTRKLTEKGFVNNDELKADALTLEQRKIQLNDAEQQKFLSETYDIPMQTKRLYADLEQAQLGLERILCRAEAEMAQKEADMRSKSAQFDLQEERFNKLKEQLEKCMIHAPQGGLVVYGQQDSGRQRWGGGDNDIIEEGASVRYRQTLITLPDVSVMILDTKVHESAIDKVDVGMKALIQVDAFPDKQFRGVVSKVAILPDSQSRWLNPDLKVYATDITLEDGSDKLKPGMSAKVEILIDRITNVVYVPIQSVFRRGGKEVCYVTSPTGTIDVRVVKPGMTNEQFVAINSGLEEGEKVLLYAPPASDDFEEEEPAQEYGESDFFRSEDAGEDAGRSGRSSKAEEMADRSSMSRERPELSEEQREKFKKMMELPEDERRKAFEKMRGESGFSFPSGGGKDRSGSGETDRGKGKSGRGRERTGYNDNSRGKPGMDRGHASGETTDHTPADTPGRSPGDAHREKPAQAE